MIRCLPGTPTNPPVPIVTRRLQIFNISMYSQCMCIFSLLGEKGEGFVFSRPLRALRAAWELGSELCTAIEDGAVHPFTEAMEMRSAWCDTNERREWGGYAVRSTPER